MLKNSLPYIALIIMTVIILLQNDGCFPEKEMEPKITIDTVIIYKEVKDTIPGKPVYISTKIDTSIWMKKSEYKPDTSYMGLLSQYRKLGNKHFSTNFFKTDFKIADYGTISITDSIRENQLIHTELTSNLNIPVTTITVEKEIPQKPKNQMFWGTGISGNKMQPISRVSLGLLLKNKKDKIYGFSLGYTGQLEYEGKLYFPIKIK